MKRTLLTLLLTAVTSAVFADGPDTVGIAARSYVTRTKTMSMVIYPNPDHTKMHLVVENHIEVPLYVSFVSDGQLLYSQKMGKRMKRFHQPFDMQNLPDGDYQIEVSDGANKVVKPFHIGTKKPANADSGRRLTVL